MFEKNMKVSYLLDFYGDVLDEHVRLVMESYYGDDLSLSEIAEDEGISRQGIRHLIKKGEEKLLFLEEKLGLAAHYKELSVLASNMEDLASRLDADTADSKEASDLFRKAAHLILTKGDI